ncbi:hypothetical protein P3T39_006724 [Kitasatospora sp. GP82]|nr:hypothetical protein [Kitasatospora sp. GP82]
MNIPGGRKERTRRSGGTTAPPGVGDRDDGDQRPPQQEWHVAGIHDPRGHALRSLGAAHGGGQLAPELGCSPQTVYKKADAGLLPGAKAIGNGKVRRTGFHVPRSVVEQYLASSEFGLKAA